MASNGHQNNGASHDASPGPAFPADSSHEEHEERGNLPAHVVRFGLVRACVWHVRTDAGPRHNVTVSRLYRGTDNAWHSSNVFSYRDLLPLAKALDCAHTYISDVIAASDAPF